MTLTVMIATWLEEHHVERIREAAPGLRVLYDLSLIEPPPHMGQKGWRRTPEQEARYRSWVGEADVLIGLDRKLAPELPGLARRLRWIQAAGSGIGDTVRSAGLDEMGIQITNAAGIQGIPLAEYALLAVLYFAKAIPARRRNQAARHWDMFMGREVRGLTAGVIGLGGAGTEIARLLRTVGMRVIGVKRTPGDPAELPVDELHTSAGLPEVLPRCDFLVLMTPHTPETEGMIGARELSLLPRGAVLINLGRGALVDEEALIDSLRSGHLGGAALDVTRVEPLPEASPLWGMENVLLTPHSAGTVSQEWDRLTDLFCENLVRYVTGEPLRNIFRA